MRRREFLSFASAAALLPLRPARGQETAPAEAATPEVIEAQGIAMHGEPKHPDGFPHFDYVNPNAPKGGRLVRSATGAFDSFNAFIARGTPAAGITSIYETLTVHGLNEPFTMYGLLAERIIYPRDRSWVQFRLHPEARWHDGEPMTSEDVVFTFEFLAAKGAPIYRFYYASVERVEALDERTVKFHFQPGENRELPLILGEMTVLPKHYWTAEGRDLSQTTLTPPLGSGPYRIGRFEPGRYIEYVRVKDYWGRDLAVNRGQYNFDVLRYDYFRDRLVERQALKAGTLDVFVENQAKAWATEYDLPAVRDGRLVKEQFENKSSGGMQNFTFNTRRPVFGDRKVRWALAHAFDFEWTNKNLFNGLYVRPNSYFFPTELAATGLPSAEELEILEPFRGRVPAEVFTEVYQPPETDGNGWPRANLEKAFDLLAEAGWVVRDMQLVEEASGRRMSFEILLSNPQFERLALPFRHNLQRLGIDVRVRTVDPSQYINRLRSFDFDMIVGGFGQSLSPGNEQRSYWSSASADEPGGYNYAGIKDPVVDEIIETVIAAPDRESLIFRTRALDRVLLWGHYGIPQWSSPFERILYWNVLGRPEVVPLQGVSFDSWWWDAEKARKLGRSTVGS